MNPRLKKNKHGANDNDGDDDKETFGIDDSARKKRRNGPLKKDTKGMVDNQQRVPQNQESSVLITQSIGLLWRLDALRIDHPQQWLAVRQVRIPFCFARRSPVMRGGGDWSESNNNTITLSFEQETRATTTTTTTTTTANVRAVPADLQAGGFEVRYLDLYEVISLALSSVKRFSISPDLCTNDDEDVLAPLAEFEYAPDGGATGDPDRQSKSAMAAAAPSLCKTDASDDDADATDNARSTTTKKNRQHATAASTTATAAAAVAAAATAHGRTADDVRIAGTRTLDKQPFADSRVRVYATTFSFDGDGDAAVDVLRHTNNDKQRAFDPRVRAKFDYLHMNTIDGAPWSTRVSAGSIFKAEIDDRVPAQLRESLREPRNSTAWRDQMARYVAAAAEQSRSPLYTAALFEDLFADKRGLETFRTLLQKRHAALDAVPNYRAVAFHLLDAVDSLLVELIDAEPNEWHVSADRTQSCESVPFLNRFFRGWDDSLYTNLRLLVYPYSANSNYNQYEYDCRRHDRCWGATESQERMKAYDWANDDDDQEKMQAHFAVKFRTTQMFEPHYAARRFYRHFIDSLNNGDRSMFAPLIPTPSGDDNANSSDNVDNANDDNANDDNANSSGSDDDDAAQQRMLRFNRLFAQVALKPAQRGALHLDILDRVASETALDNGFMLTFLFDPTDSIDSSMQNEFGNLYAGVRRQEKNPFQRFAEQVEHFLFGTQQDRDAARERYKPVVSYINNYILPRVENAALFRPLAQYNLPEPLLSLTQLVECRGEETFPEYDVQEAKEADIINWKAFEATLNFRLSDRAVADRCANLPLEAFQHNALDDYSKATSFVQTCIKHAAPYNRSADRKEMPFSYLYDYALYCIDRKLNRRIAKNVEHYAAADLRREQAYLANRHDPNYIYYDDHPEEPHDFLAPPTTTTAASSSSRAAGAAATTATVPKRVSALARWYKKN